MAVRHVLTSRWGNVVSQADALQGKNLCEAWHATGVLKPTFGLHFSSTWTHVSNQSGAPCDPDDEPLASEPRTHAR